MKRIAQIEKSYMRDDIPQFGSGDTVRVHVRIVEGDKERIRKRIEGGPRHRHKRWRKRAYGPFPPDMMFMRGHHGPEDFTVEVEEEDREEASED